MRAPPPPKKNPLKYDVIISCVIAPKAGVPQDGLEWTLLFPAHLSVGCFYKFVSEDFFHLIRIGKIWLARIKSYNLFNVSLIATVGNGEIRSGNWNTCFIPIFARGRLSDYTTTKALAYFVAQRYSLYLYTGILRHIESSMLRLFKK